MLIFILTILMEDDVVPFLARTGSHMLSIDVRNCQSCPEGDLA